MLLQILLHFFEKITQLTNIALIHVFALIKGIDKALQRITIKSFEHAVAFFLLVVLF